MHVCTCECSDNQQDHPSCTCLYMWAQWQPTRSPFMHMFVHVSAVTTMKITLYAHVHTCECSDNHEDHPSCTCSYMWVQWHGNVETYRETQSGLAILLTWGLEERLPWVEWERWSKQASKNQQQQQQNWKKCGVCACISSSMQSTIIKKCFLGHGWVAQLVRALGRYTKVAGSVSSQGTGENQPMNALISGMTKQCLSLLPFSLSQINQ